MTTPNQGLPSTIETLLGIDAYTAGDGTGTHYGQNIGADLVMSLINGGAPTLAQAFEDLPSFLVKLAEFLVTMPLDALKALRSFLPGTSADDFEDGPTAVNTIINALGLNHLKMTLTHFLAWVADFFDPLVTIINQILDIVRGVLVTPINEGVQAFKDWFNGIVEKFGYVAELIGNIIDGLWGGLTGHSGSGKSAADVANAASVSASKADSATSLSELNSQILAIRNNESIMSGIDEAEESNFLVTDMFSDGSDPVGVISATASSVPVAYWRAKQASLKGTISWFGKGVTNVTALYLDVYRANYETNQWELIHTSPDQTPLLDNTWRYLLYSVVDEEDRIQVNPGDVLGVAWRVEGTGTHSIGGKKAGSWFKDHPATTAPTRPASTRTGSGSLDFDDTVYSGDTPWFGIGIITGDIKPPVLTPRKQTYDEPGAFVYTIPEQFRSEGNIINVIICPAGGGGSAIPAAPGGGAGDWVGVSLVYGTDITPGTTTLSGFVGDGGDGGTIGDVNGKDGDDSYVVVPGHGTITAHGGIQSGAPGFFGESPGDFSFDGTPYRGGAKATVPSQDGFAPGGGGGSWSFGGGGGSGAHAQVWFVAKQP